MTNTISDNDIKRIFATLSRRGVKYIDLQHELVDHLASDIDQISIEQPKLNFQQKLDLAFSRFPNDLGILVRTKEKALNRYWQRKTIGFVKSYFQFPKVIFTLSLFLSTAIGTIYLGKPVMTTMLIITIIVLIYTLARSYRSMNYSRENETKYLVLRMFYGQITLVAFLPLNIINIAQVFGFNSFRIQSSWYVYLLTAIMVFTLIWCHACLTAFPDMLKEELSRKYPYLSIVNN